MHIILQCMYVLLLLRKAKAELKNSKKKIETLHTRKIIYHFHLINLKDMKSHAITT